MQRAIRELQRSSLVALAIGLCIASHTAAQSWFMRRISTAHGLSDNLVYDATMDKHGLLWIATAAGVNSFDGARVSVWHSFTDKYLLTREVHDLWADAADNIWMLGANDRLVRFDARRRPQVIHYANPTDSGNIRFLLPQPSTGHLYLLVDKKLMRVRKGATSIEKLSDLPDSLMRLNFAQEHPAGPDEYLLAGSNRVVLLSLSKAAVAASWQVPRALCALRLPSGLLLVSTEYNRQLLVIDPVSGKVLDNLGILPDQHGRPVRGYLRYMTPLADGRIAITSGYGGLYVVDVTRKKLWNYSHDPLNDQSLSGNNTFRIRSTPHGFLFVTTRSSGINMINIYQQQATAIKRFQDTVSHRVFDGFVSPMAQEANGSIWLGSQGGLFQWKGEGSAVRFKEYGVFEGESIAGKEEVRALHAHADGKRWIGLNRYGVVVLNRVGKVVASLQRQNSDSLQQLPSNFVQQITTIPGDSLIWIATGGGLRFAHPASMRLVPHLQQRLLDTFKRKNVTQIWARHAGEIWIATSRGAWQYLPEQNSLRHIFKNDGMANTMVQSIAGDSLGTVYMAGRSGLDIRKSDGTITTWNRANGLPEDFCQSVVTDKAGRVWVGNTDYLVAFDAAQQTHRIFDASYGFLGNGFRPQSAYRLLDGRLLFGCNEGITVFDPDAMWHTREAVEVRVASMQAADSIQYFAGTVQLQLAPSQNAPVFQLQTIAMQGWQSIEVQYRLVGSDSTWKQPDANRQVVTNGLPAGNYTLQLRYRIGQAGWQPGANQVSFRISTHWYQSSWFFALAAALVLTLLAWLWHLRKVQMRLRQEEAETERVILQLSHTLHEHQQVPDMLWALTQNIMSRMQLEDCVVYLLDRQRQILYQQAAWGPKQTCDQHIDAPIEIPVGQGIVGHVAATGAPVLVADTRLDSRYIVDDQHRLSELAVPIVADGQVLGVIDSEHSRRGFFTRKHMAIFTTIASVLGSRLASLQASAERLSAEYALLENKQRLSEVEMKALRAQMNPHFLFNSLNSINNFILKNDAENASAYLTRFARLMRLILDNSRHEWISLEQELQSLQLYIELEQLRFDTAFSYKVQVAPQVDVLRWQIPPMMLQPYVENAIWHGLLHRPQGGGVLNIGVAVLPDERLAITIEDDGVGRLAAAEKRTQQRSRHKQSHGMQITAERLDMINAVYAIDALAFIDDLYNENGSPIGTRVTITMKYRSHESHTA